MGELMQPNQPAKFEARNPRPAFRRTKSGDIYTLNIEIDEETWATLKTMPDNAILECLLWFHDGDVQIEEKPAREKKEKEPKGPHGAFWNRLFKYHATDKQQFFNHPDFQTVFNLAPPVTSEIAKLTLREEFGVNSLTFVSPEQFVDFCVSNDLHSIATIASRLASETATLSVS